MLAYHPGYFIAGLQGVLMVWAENLWFLSEDFAEQGFSPGMMTLLTNRPCQLILGSYRGSMVWSQHAELGCEQLLEVGLRSSVITSSRSGPGDAMPGRQCFRMIRA